MSNHQCHAIGCDVNVPPKMLMCRKHWAMVPKLIQGAIWQNYRPGQEIDKRPSARYLEAQKMAIAAVKEKEDKAVDIS